MRFYRYYRNLVKEILNHTSHRVSNTIEEFFDGSIIVSRAELWNFLKYFFYSYNRTLKIKLNFSNLIYLLF